MNPKQYKAYSKKIRKEFDTLEDEGKVRIRVEPDESCDYEDLAGDTFNPDVNNDIPVEQLEREEREFKNRLECDGVWGVIGEVKCAHCGNWEHVDSCWGFVGDDWKESGYDVDIMAACIEAYKNQK